MTSKRADYVCGVGLNAGGRLVTYFFRASRGEAGRGKARGDISFVLEEHGIHGTPTDAATARNALARKHRPTAAEARAAFIASVDAERRERLRLKLATSEIGRVALHKDKRGHHLAVLLDAEPEPLALFLTTSPSWARHARLATDDEIAAIAPRSAWCTFLASVVRPRQEFTLQETSLPARMVEALRAEFTRERASQRR